MVEVLLRKRWKQKSTSSTDEDKHKDKDSSIPSLCTSGNDAVESLEESFNVGGVILVPTRELASQIYDLLKLYIRESNKCHKSSNTRSGCDGNSDEGLLDCVMFRGGVGVNVDLDVIDSQQSRTTSHIIVATPGRLSHLLEEKPKWNLREVEMVVLDEADRLLDMGFSLQLTQILSALPRQRRTGVFSATLSADVQGIVKAGLRNPVYVRVDHPQADAIDHIKQPADKGEQEEGEKKGEEHLKGTGNPGMATFLGDVCATPSGLSNFYVEIECQHKLGFITKFLKSLDRSHKVIIFCLTCNCVEFYHTALAADQKNRRVEKLHGKMTQTARTHSYDNFRKMGGVMIATDVAARGLDIPDIVWIVQIDPPQDPSYFIHRIGRTARAGRSGNSLLLVMSHEMAYLPYLHSKKVTLQDLSKSTHADVVRGCSEIKEGPYGVFGLDEADCRAALETVRTFIVKDRALYDKAAKAFVSFVRAYKEHKLAFIFPFKKLNLGALGTSFCLLRLPRVKEILGRELKDFRQANVDIDGIAYKDPNREARRQKLMTSRNEEKAARLQEEMKRKSTPTPPQPKNRTRTEKRHATM
eukprot:GHVQ01030362.1.p1 GENE.GHVQ01030362.1~~GHVQ01030362.1.p1  ORF type:complete len:624 (+),score=102.85 GHVQ01030362.1:122-1873(+)